MKVLAIVNHKGGTSKTTIAKVLTEYLSQKGLRVLGIDVDAQCNYSARFIDMEVTESAGYWPPVHPDYDPNDPDDSEWNGRCSVATLYRQGWTMPYESSDWPGVQIIPSDGEALSDLENLVSGNDRAATYMRPLLADWLKQAADEDIDFVIIDTPPSKGPLIDSVFTAATHILIPSQMEELSIEGLYSMLTYRGHENMRRAGDKLKLVGILATQVDARRADHKQYIEYLTENDATGPYMMKSTMSQRAAYNYANTTGAEYRSVLNRPPRDTTRIEAEAICEEIMERINHV